MNNLNVENLVAGYTSEGLAEYVITLFPDGYRGVCIDVGAFAPFWLSNSWLFEYNNWYTYCIEPNPNCIQELNTYRKNVLDYACSNYNDDDVEFFIFSNTTVGEAGGTGLINHDDAWVKTLYKESVLVKVRTLDWLLENVIKVDKIDFLSIDVEHNEVAVLKGINLEKWKPTVVAIESLSDDEQKQQSDILIPNGYRLVRRIVFNDIYILDSYYESFVEKKE